MTALTYAARGWPVLPADGKVPLTAHGVKDASTDPTVVEGWWRRWPNANVAIACGAPGPQVLDVDDLDAARGVLGRLARAPAVATARGRHFYFAGQDRGTVVLDYGELRGQGSYVIAPPSVHPTGREYVWLLEPRAALPAVPELVARDGQTAGCGEHRPPPAPIVAGEGRHPYLKDFAVRLVRAGVTDASRIEAHLRLEFGLSCEPKPDPAAGYFEALSKWAAHSRIAARELRLAELAERIRQEEMRR